MFISIIVMQNRKQNIKWWWGVREEAAKEVKEEERMEKNKNMFALWSNGHRLNQLCHESLDISPIKEIEDKELNVVSFVSTVLPI